MIDKIGSAGWYQKLEAEGVSRRYVEAIFLEVFGRSEPDGGVDAHGVNFSASYLLRNRDVGDVAVFEEIVRCEEKVQALLEAAVWVLFHEKNPGYAAQMYLRLQVWFGWRDVRGARHVRRWICRQLAAMILHSTERVCESAWYAIGVDYFESPQDAREAFGWLAEDLGEAYWEKLLRDSGYVTWEGKEAFYFALARDEVWHQRVYQALCDSCTSAMLGSVNVKKGLSVLMDLDVSEQEIQHARRLLLGPMKARILGVMYTRKRRGEDASGLIALEFLGPMYMWVSGSILYDGDEKLGVFEDFRVGSGLLEDVLEVREGEDAWRVAYVREEEGRHVRWHRFRGGVNALKRRVGENVTLRPW